MGKLTNVLLVIIAVLILIAIFSPKTLGLKTEAPATPPVPPPNPTPAPADNSTTNIYPTTYVPLYYFPVSGNCKGSDNKCTPAFNQGGVDYFYVGQSGGKCMYSTTKDTSCTSRIPNVKGGA